MENNTEQKEPIIYKIMGIAFLSFIVFGILCDIIFVSITGNYIIGYTTEIKKSGYRGKRIHYVYIYEGKQSREHKIALYPKVKMQQKYLVKFWPLFPSFNQLEVNYPVPDSIRMEDVPEKGWEKLPDWAEWTPAD